MTQTPAQRRIDPSKPLNEQGLRPKPEKPVTIEERVNQIAAGFRDIVRLVDEKPDLMDQAKLRKLEYFLAVQLGDMTRAVGLILTKKPVLGSSFSFDMELPTPDPAPTTGIAHPTIMNSLVSTPERPNTFVMPEGRLVGTKEPVYPGAPAAPSPVPQISPSAPLVPEDDDEAGFLEDED